MVNHSGSAWWESIAFCGVVVIPLGLQGVQPPWFPPPELQGSARLRSGVISARGSPGRGATRGGEFPAGGNPLQRVGEKRKHWGITQPAPWGRAVLASCAAVHDTSAPASWRERFSVSHGRWGGCSLAPQALVELAGEQGMQLTRVGRTMTSLQTLAATGGQSGLLHKKGPVACSSCLR